jgi:hypothetical protein
MRLLARDTRVEVQVELVLPLGVDDRLVAGFSFRVSGFGVWDLVSGFRILGFGFRIYGFGLRDSGFGVRSYLRLVALPRGRVGVRVLVREKPAGRWVPGFGFRVSCFGFRIYNQGFVLEISGFRFRISGSRFLFSSFGFRVQVSGFEYQVGGLRMWFGV